MLSPVIKVVDPQIDFRPVKYSDLKEKTIVDPSGAFAKFIAERVKEQKQEEIRKCAENWCLI